MEFKAEQIVNDKTDLIRQKSEKVQLPLSKEDKELALSLLKYVQDSQDEEIAKANNMRPAVGIAAIQLGIKKQLIAICIPYEDDEPEIFVLANPRIVSHSLTQAYLKGGEGCLSVDEPHEGYVPRAARIKVRGYDCIAEEEVEIRAEEYPAIVLQHEIDHFKGILFYDHINKENPWQEIPDAIVIE